MHKNPKEFYTEKMQCITKQHTILNLAIATNTMEGFSEYEELLKEKNMMTIDFYREIPRNADDMSELSSIPSNSIDAIICGAIIDHIENPILLCQEMHRILKPGGMCFIYAPFLYAYHAKKGSYGDFFRFSTDALTWMLKGFSTVEMVPVRGRCETVLKLLPIGKIKRIGTHIARLVDSWFPAPQQSSGYYVYVVK